jgi:transposase
MVVRLMYLTAVRVFGWFNGGWTLADVATVIRRRFGVVYRYRRRWPACCTSGVSPSNARPGGRSNPTSRQ